LLGAGFPHRCFEGTYILTLLRDGFGFGEESRSVSFVYDIGGEEVEWTLGVLLGQIKNN